MQAELAGRCITSLLDPGEHPAPRYSWTFEVTGKTVSLCPRCCVYWREVATEEWWAPGLTASRITEIPPTSLE